MIRFHDVILIFGVYDFDNFVVVLKLSSNQFQNTCNYTDFPAKRFGNLEKRVISTD